MGPRGNELATLFAKKSPLGLVIPICLHIHVKRKTDNLRNRVSGGPAAAPVKRETIAARPPHRVKMLAFERFAVEIRDLLNERTEQEKAY
jgi:hypothetical protein